MEQHNGDRPIKKIVAVSGTAHETRLTYRVKYKERSVRRSGETLEFLVDARGERHPVPHGAQAEWEPVCEGVSTRRERSEERFGSTTWCEEVIHLRIERENCPIEVGIRSEQSIWNKDSEGSSESDRYVVRYVAAPDADGAPDPEPGGPSR